MLMIVFGEKTLESTALDILNGASGTHAIVLNNRRKLANHYITVMEARGGGKKLVLADYMKLVDESNADQMCNLLTQDLF